MLATGDLRSDETKRLRGRWWAARVRSKVISGMRVAARNFMRF